MKEKKVSVTVKAIDKVYEATPIGAPYEEVTRRKVLFDAGHMVGNLVRLYEISLDDLLDELSTYPKLIEIISDGDSKHIQIDTKYEALKDEVVNRLIQQHIAKKEIKEILDK